MVVRDCGATTSKYTRVIVRPNAGGSAEVEEVVFTVRHRHGIEVFWTNPAELLVKCFGCTEQEIERQMSKTGTLKISYELQNEGQKDRE